MEAQNPILKYLFPIILLLQYYACDSKRVVLDEYVAQAAETTSVIDCDELKKFEYNGFYAPKEDGKFLKKQDEYYTDSIHIAKEPLITFQDVKSVQKTFDNFSNPCVLVLLNENATLVFKEHTGKNIGKKIAIVIKDSLISAPVINSEIAGGQVQITSSFTQQEVDELYNYLNLLKDCK